MLKRIASLVKYTETKLDDFFLTTIRGKIMPLFYYGAFYLGIMHLTLNASLAKAVNFLGLGLLTIMGASSVSSLLVYALSLYLEKKDKDLSQDYAPKVILKLVQAAVWGLAIVLLLDNFIEIDALIAGLGIGGIAIGFAAQAILQDVFSYFSIFFDRPFEIGDFIIIGEYMGTVEHIGLKTTRLRSINGEQLILSNGDLTSSRLRNYKRMAVRRVLFTIGVKYETSLEKLKEIPVLIKNIIEKMDDVSFERVHFASYGNFSLNYEIVYYINDRDYNKYMDIQQEINFKLKEEFDKRGIEFAYPTQTVYINQSH
jgi:small-conductance mechanosensitive channel